MTPTFPGGFSIRTRSRAGERAPAMERRVKAIGVPYGLPMAPDEHKGPDLSTGVDSASLCDGQTVLGRVGGEGVELTRSGGKTFAVGASCTHYGGPRGKGLVVGDAIRCPLRHSCCSLRTGEALRAP